MMHSEVIEAIRRQGLPPVFVDVCMGHTPDTFVGFWGSPRDVLDVGEPLEHYAPSLEGFCPLLEVNGEALIGFLPESDRFVRVYFEDLGQGDDGVETLGRGYQQFALVLLLQAAEVLSVSRVEELASVLEFKHTAELASLLNEDSYSDKAIGDLKTRLDSGRS